MSKIAAYIEEALPKGPLDHDVEGIARLGDITVPNLDRPCTVYLAHDGSIAMMFARVMPDTFRRDNGEPVPAGLYPIVWASLKD